MTAIAAIKHNNRIYMGCDSLTSFGDLVSVSPHRKIWRNGEILIGSAGSLKHINLIKFSTFPVHQQGDSDLKYLTLNFANSIRETLKEHGALEVKNSEEKSNWITLLIGYRGKIFMMSHDFSITEHDDYYAIGSGGELALGSLYSTFGLPPTDRLRISLEVAAKFNNGCRGPFHYEEL